METGRAGRASAAGDEGWGSGVRRVDGTRGRLTRERVVAAALAVVDRDGLDGLTMRMLGHLLGVDPMAVYHWFPNKLAILQGVVEAILAEVPTDAEATGPWQDWVRVVAREYRRVLLAHPNALPIVSTQPVLTPAGLRVVEVACRPLVAAGFRPTDALALVNDVAALVIGSVLVQAGVTPGTEPISDEQVRGAYGSLDGSAFPLVAQAIREAGPDDFDSEQQFENLLDTFVRGLDLQRPGGPGTVAAPPATRA
jgi:AcrR family transcriptional regulator